jgi:hypothetical protein
MIQLYHYLRRGKRHRSIKRVIETLAVLWETGRELVNRGAPIHWLRQEKDKFKTILRE